jgi:hypothetical protein
MRSIPTVFLLAPASCLLAFKSEIERCLVPSIYAVRCQQLAVFRLAPCTLSLEPLTYQLPFDEIVLDFCTAPQGVFAPR